MFFTCSGSSLCSRGKQCSATAVRTRSGPPRDASRSSRSDDSTAPRLRAEYLLRDLLKKSTAGIYERNPHTAGEILMW